MLNQIAPQTLHVPQKALKPLPVAEKHNIPASLIYGAHSWAEVLECVALADQHGITFGYDDGKYFEKSCANTLGRGTHTWKVYSNNDNPRTTDVVMIRHLARTKFCPTCEREEREVDMHFHAMAIHEECDCEDCQCPQ